MYVKHRVTSSEIVIVTCQMPWQSWTKLGFPVLSGLLRLKNVYFCVLVLSFVLPRIVPQAHLQSAHWISFLRLRFGIYHPLCHLVLDFYLTESRCSPGIWHTPEFTRATVIDNGQVFVFPSCCSFWQWTCWARHETSGSMMNALNTYTTISNLLESYCGFTSVEWFFK